MAFKVIIQTDDPQIKAAQREIQHIMMDALYEFSANRGPTGADYVARRYPGDGVYSTEEKIRKARQVEARKFMADRLHEAMGFFEVVHASPADTPMAEDYDRVERESRS